MTGYLMSPIISYKVRFFIEPEFTYNTIFFLKNLKHPHVAYTKIIMKSGRS